MDRALAFFKRMDFCEQNSYDGNVKATVIIKATSFLISAFSDNQINEPRFHDDAIMLRDYTKKYSKEIKGYGTGMLAVIRTLWIARSPKSYVRVYKFLKRVVKRKI